LLIEYEVKLILVNPFKQVEQDNASVTLTASFFMPWKMLFY